MCYDKIIAWSGDVFHILFKDYTHMIISCMHVFVICSLKIFSLLCMHAYTHYEKVSKLCMWLYSSMHECMHLCGTSHNSICAYTYPCKCPCNINSIVLTRLFDPVYAVADNWIFSIKSKNLNIFYRKVLHNVKITQANKKAFITHLNKLENSKTLKNEVLDT